jgi:hypothetical protein
MMKQLTTTIIGGVFLIAICIMFSACGELPVAAPAHLPPCYPAQNAYAAPIHSNFIDIYDRGVASVNDIGRYNSTRQEAFNELVNQVYHWSDSVEINNDTTGKKTFRITITYVSPELIHLIILNHYLYKGISYPPGKVEAQVRGHMSKIIENEEHIFFIMFMAPPSADSTTIEFPLNGLILTNASNLPVYVNHDDHNLEGSISLKTGLEYGFFYIPMTVTKDGRCQTVLDKNHDTRIVLSIPKITINGANAGPQTWEYKYAPLIDLTTISPVQPYPFSLVQQMDQISPDTKQLSSRTSQLVSTDLEDDGYWAAIARFLWYETTFDP